MCHVAQRRADVPCPRWRQPSFCQCFSSCCHLGFNLRKTPEKPQFIYIYIYTDGLKLRMSFWKRTRANSTPHVYKYLGYTPFVFFEYPACVARKLWDTGIFTLSRHEKQPGVNPSYIPASSSCKLASKSFSSASLVSLHLASSCQTLAPSVFS